MKRQLVCRHPRRMGGKKLCVYVYRNKHGRIVKVTNVHRSIRRDMAIKAKRKLFRPRDTGRGFLGDY